MGRQADANENRLSDGVTTLGRWPLWLAGIFLVATMASLAIDGRLAQWFTTHEFPPVVRKLLQLSELFGHGLGILAVGLLIFQLDPIRRWLVPRVLFVAIGSGVAADVVKVLVSRLRPRYCGLENSYCGLENSVWDVVSGWFVVAGEGKSQSFPSGHAAAAVGLALALAALYPRGRWLFAAFAFLACWQRVDEGAHFLSDLMCGAAIGSLMAAACLGRGPLARLFGRRESLLRSLLGSPSRSSHLT